ncbi:hypothetical protein Acr_03g0012550 [Actinidia rufa]|uniref:Remorin family protein n=1 Tax=Actinidia rufa TaxID=165716 RepID=A0A7J0EDE1_9ERIC|nr:hypothetical protein Acr_03g0012550 [Actinidia rufa]
MLLCAKGSLGTTISIRAKFESPESHQSDFGSDRKPISNSDQIQSAQNQHLSIPPGLVETKLQHQTASKSDARLALTRRPKFGASVPHATSNPRRPSGDVPGEDISQNKAFNKEACVESLERDYSSRTYERVPEERGRTLSAFIATRKDKMNCPRYKAQNQSSESATTAVMAVDKHRDVVYICSMRGTCTGYSQIPHGRDERSMKVTEVRYFPSLRKNLISIEMQDSKGINFESSGGTLRVSKGNRKCCGEGRLKGYTDWRGVSRQEELLSDISPVVLARRMDKEILVVCRELRVSQYSENYICSGSIPRAAFVVAFRELLTSGSSSLLHLVPVCYDFSYCIRWATRELHLAASVLHWAVSNCILITCPVHSDRANRAEPTVQSHPYTVAVFDSQAEPNCARGRLPSEPTGQSRTVPGAECLVEPTGQSRTVPGAECLAESTEQSRPCQGQTPKPVPVSAPQLGVAWHLHEKVQTLQFGSAFTSVEVELPVEEGQRISNDAAYERRKAVFAEEAKEREKQLTEAVKEGCRGVQDGGHLSSPKSQMWACISAAMSSCSLLCGL